MMNEAMIREIREARAAGLRALNSLRRAKQCLDSARGWGIWDMLGGGLISSLIKHSRLGDAQRCIEDAQRNLELFRKELMDVELPYVQIHGFLNFADYFFDGFVADFLVQRRINEAREQLDVACRQVEYALSQLPEV